MTMTPDRLIAHANRVRDIVLGAEGRVIRTPRTPPRAAFRNNARGRKAWLDRAAIKLARDPRVFGESEG
jgi:hypothetical protein